MNYPKAEILIIDNNSQDGSDSFLKKIKKPNTRVFLNKKNVGFSKAVNLGITESKTDTILLLNPDTVPNHNAISILFRFLESKKNIGFLGGKMIHQTKGTINGTYVSKPNFFTGIFEFTNLKKILPKNKFSQDFYYKKVKVNKPLSVYALSGGFLMFKKKLIEKIGFFDEKFFMYLEDVDIGIRAKKMGFHNYYIPSATILHDSGSSSSNSIYRINVQAWRHSKKYFFTKHFNPILATPLRIIFFLDNLVTDLKHVIFKEPLR